MQKRPLALIAASCLFFYFPADLIFRLASGQFLSISDWFVSGFLPLLVSIGLIRVTRVGWYALFGFIFLWGVKDFLSVRDEAASFSQVFIHVVVYLLGLSYFINPRIRRLYFDPKLRWWRAKKRYETHGPAIIFRENKPSYPVLRNISEGGCFVETPHTFDVSDLITLVIPLPEPVPVSSLTFKGEVRWVSQQSERMGMGIQFQALTQLDKKHLKKFLSQQ